MKLKRIAIVLSLAGCVYPGRATREERMAIASDERTRFCAGDIEPAVEKVLGQVKAVWPLYVKLRTGPRNSYAQKLVGAQLEVAAGQAMTAEELQRLLRCHQARRALGEVAPAETDPFSLADSWIDIQVRSERQGLIVSLRGQTAEESQLIDSKAEALIAAKGACEQPPSICSLQE